MSASELREDSRPLWRRLLAAPALHFTVAGALLFAGTSALGTAGDDGATAVSREIVIDASRIRGLRRDYGLANRVVASEEETRALVESLINDEVLFREGIRQGFEQDDRSIAFRLAQKMHYLGEDNGEDTPALYRRGLEMGLHLSDPIVRSIMVEKVRLIVGRSAPKPTDQELADWFAAHRSDYQQSGRVSLRHVYFDRTRRDAEGAREAATAAAVSARGHGGDVEDSLGGDSFVMGSRLAAQGRGDLTKFFGPAFADEVLSLAEGGWSEPIESTYGWHLVWIEKRIDPRVPELAEVRSRVEKSYESSQRDERVARFLATKRAGYTIRIDEDAIREQSRG